MRQRTRIIAPLLVIFALTATARAEEIAPPSRNLPGHSGSVLCVEFTHDGETLLSSSRDSTIRIWDVATGQLRQTLTNHTADVYCVAFNQAGDLMASGSTDTSIILWDAKTFTPIRTLKGHTAAVREVEFSPDDKTLASVGEDNTFRLWDVATGELKVTRTEHTKKVKSVAWYPDGQSIVTASHDLTLRIWDAHGEPKKVLEGHKDVLETVDISPDGKQLFSGTGTDWGELIFWNAQTGEIERQLSTAHGNEHGKEIDSVSYSPDGKWAVSGSKDRSIKFWNPKTYTLVHTISNNPGRIESMNFSRDGKMLVVGYGGTDHSIRIFDLSGMKN